jgi:hypothetical protein
MVGEAGFDWGGESGSGVIGLCQDCTEWKESALEEIPEEIDSMVSILGRLIGDSDLDPFEGGEVTRVSCGGAVMDRVASWLKTKGRIVERGKLFRGVTFVSSVASLSFPS